MGKEYKKIHRLLNEVMMMRAEEGVNAEVLAEHYGVGIQESFPKLNQWYRYWSDQSLMKKNMPW